MLSYPERAILPKDGWPPTLCGRVAQLAEQLTLNQ